MERYREAEWIFFERHIYMVCNRDLLKKRKAESEGMEEHTPLK